MEVKPHTLAKATPRVIFALAVCMALQMTSFAIILPIFPLRVSQLGGGVGALGVSTMAYALTSTLAAPYMGALADRWSRRKVLLGSLAVYALAFTGYFLAPSVAVFVIVRGIAGVFTAGLIPAVMGLIADKTPVSRRAQYIGIVNGGGSIGWIIGPLIGGALADRWGLSAAFICSIMMAAITWLAALITIPETRQVMQASLTATTPTASTVQRNGLLSTMRSLVLDLPRPVRTFVVLMLVSFTVFLAWSFIEPELLFYAYEGLNWTSSQLGAVMSAFGIAMMLGEFTLGRLSDRIGRKPVLIVGLALFSMQFVGLVFFSHFTWIAIFFVFAGLGNALFDPALNAYLLDITPRSHEGRVMGLKSTAGSLGNVVGPGLIVLATSHLPSKTIFLCSALLVAVVTLLSLSLLNRQDRNQPLKFNNYT